MKCLFILLATVALAQSASIKFFPVIYEPPSNGGIPNPPSKTCINGELRSVDSRHWWECTNNQWVYWTCPKGTYVDMDTLQCNFVTSSPTSTQSPTSGYCRPGSTEPVVYDNSMFKYCLDNYKWMEFQCPLGAVYDPKEPSFCSWVTDNPSSTTTTTTTTNAPETWCKAGFYKENQDDCRSYYQCDNGHWRAMPCAGGTGWDQLNLTCNHIDLVCTGDFKPKSGHRPSTKKPNNNNGF